MNLIVSTIFCLGESGFMDDVIDLNESSFQVFEFSSFQVFKLLII